MKKTIIAAVRTSAELDIAMKSACEIIFDLAPDILTIESVVADAHKNNKKLYIHLDLANGIGKDKSGITYAANIGIDGIISTRVNIIKLAREAGLATVQRFFIVDTHSAETTVESLKISRAEMIEVMPGVAKTVSVLKGRVSVPIIAGGLIETETEVQDALNAGAMAISTGNKSLWG